MCSTHQTIRSRTVIPTLGLHIKQCQKLACTYKIRVEIDNLFELDDRHIVIPMLCRLQCCIVLLDRLIVRIQLVRIRLNFTNVLFRIIIFVLIKFAKNPFTQRSYDLAFLIVDQTQQISSTGI